MTTLAEHQREATETYLRRVLRGRTVTEAAGIAGVSRPYFYQLLAKHGIEPPHVGSGNRPSWYGLSNHT